MFTDWSGTSPVSHVSVTSIISDLCCSITTTSSVFFWKMDRALNRSTFGITCLCLHPNADDFGILIKLFLLTIMLSFLVLFEKRFSREVILTVIGCIKLSLGNGFLWRVTLGVKCTAFSLSSWKWGLSVTQELFDFFRHGMHRTNLGQKFSLSSKEAAAEGTLTFAEIAPFWRLLKIEIIAGSTLRLNKTRFVPCEHPQKFPIKRNVSFCSDFCLHLWIRHRCLAIVLLHVH